jgi:mannosyltransferase
MLDAPSAGSAPGSAGSAPGSAGTARGSGGTARGSGGTGQRWLLAYGAALTALGLVNIFALTLIPAHALTVCLARRHADSPAGPAVPAPRRPGRRAGRSPLAGWLAAAAVALTVTAPVDWFAWQQRGAQQWLKSPDLTMLSKLHFLIGPATLVGLALLIVACGLAWSMLAGRARISANWPGQMVCLCVPWLLLPPAILISVSLIQPVYTLRYVLFCLPAAAIIGGASLAALGRWVGPAALALVVVLAVPAQVTDRRTAAHGDNIRLADREVAAAYQPGDAVLYVSQDARYMAAAYPYGLPSLRNIGLAQGRVLSGTLAGTYLPHPAIHRRLARVRRVWVVAVGIHPLAHLPLLHGLHFHLVRQYHPSDIWLLLYRHPVRTPSQPSRPAR